MTDHRPIIGRLILKSPDSSTFPWPTRSEQNLTTFKQIVKQKLKARIEPKTSWFQSHDKAQFTTEPNSFTCKVDLILNIAQLHNYLNIKKLLEMSNLLFYIYDIHYTIYIYIVYFKKIPLLKGTANRQKIFLKKIQTRGPRDRPKVCLLGPFFLMMSL